MQAVQPKVKTRPARRYIWVLWASALLLMAAGVTSTSLTWTADTGPRWGFRGITLLLVPVFCTIGALIVSRHPRHAVGWLMVYTGLMSALQHLLEEYAIWALLAAPGQLPGGTLVAWVVNFIWLPMAFPLVMLLPFVYPNGRLPSPRWRWWPWLGLATIGCLMLVWMFAPGPLLSSFTFVQNPFGWPAGETLLGQLQALGFMVALVVLALGIAALLWRMRHADGLQRQQLKWFIYAAAIMTISVFGAPSGNVFAHIFVIAGIMGLALAVGAAILRYRLYDLDLLINRTLVYAGLTATLGLLYFGSVLLLQAVFLTLTGEGQPQLVTVLSTLAIAALFSPVRSRLQGFIDRRFFRKKYDAARTLAAFSTTLRDETNLTQLSTLMVQVIDETMQPAQVSVWLKHDPARRGE